MATTANKKVEALVPGDTVVTLGSRVVAEVCKIHNPRGMCEVFFTDATAKIMWATRWVVVAHA